MKTKVTIQNDDSGQFAYDQFTDRISVEVNEDDVFCEIKNNSYINLVEEWKNYTSSKWNYKRKTIVSAKGYYQGEWQEYTLYHNEPIDELVALLEKTFTHQNGYFVEKSEFTDIDGKIMTAEPHDFTFFDIDWIEFPDKKDIIDAYIDIYGVDYDEIEYIS